jgi:hypothetical protein
MGHTARILYIATTSSHATYPDRRVCHPIISTVMPATTSGPRTLYDKVFDDHLVYEGEGDTLIYIDRHLVHEVTSPQAFEGL